jgi:outer membrane protein assembly factor BamB
VLEKREFDKNEFLARLATAVTVVSGFFSVIVFTMLLFNFLQVEAADPVDNLMLTKMRQEYASLPQQDEVLAQRIRDLDMLNRKAFFTSQGHLRTGATLLLIGICTFLIAFKYSLRWRREKPVLETVPTADKEFLALAESRQLITWASVAMLAIGLGATLLTESAVVRDSSMVASAALDSAGEESAAKDAATEAAAAPAITWEQMEKNWPSFRGPGSLGKAHFTNAPTSWDLAAGTNVKWKVDLTMPGYNSPVIWGDRLYLSAADETAHEIYCFNVNDGSQLWKQVVPKQEGAPATPPKVTDDTGFAAPTMAAHGDQVFAIFANGDLVSYDKDGKLVWGRNVGLPNNHYGHSSSLIAYDKFLYVQLDQKTDPKLMALDVATGKELWKAQRTAISWASPIVAQTEFGPQLILCNESHVDAYDPITGAQLWTQECLSGEVAPSPAYANGMVFAANEYAVATGIQLAKGAEGIEASIAWQYDELLPEVSSPVGDGERFYFGTAAGILVCLDAKSGEKLWEHELDSGFYSSPVLVGDRIYVLDNDGVMQIIKAGPAYESIAAIPTGEVAHATPAFMDGRIYLRSQNHLYCIEQSNG